MIVFYVYDFKENQVSLIDDDIKRARFNRQYGFNKHNKVESLPSKFGVRYFISDDIVIVSEDYVTLTIFVQGMAEELKLQGRM